jgi:hypothetical protein
MDRPDGPQEHLSSGAAVADFGRWPRANQSVR